MLVGEPVGCSSSRRWPRVIAPTGSKSAGMPNASRVAASYSRRDAEEARAEALVDGGQQDQQARHRGVHVPERHRPARLVLVGPALVLLGVATEVRRLARAGDDHDRRASACPRSQLSGSSPGVVVTAQNRATSAGSSSTRNAQPWLKPALGRADRVGERAVDDGRVDRGVGVVADHAAAADDVLELHGAQCA